MRLLGNILDRAILVFGVLLGGALQSFIIQYRQNAIGHFNEAIANLGKFQQVANNHFGGELNSLIHRYLENADASIRETGEAIRAIRESAQFWDSAVHALNGGPFSQMWAMVRYFHYDTLAATWDAFQPAFSFSTDALIMSGCIGIAIWVFYLCLIWFITLCARKTQHKRGYRGF